MLKEKKFKVIMIIILLIVVAAIFGYYGYCHHMVSKFYKYIDAGDTEGAISCVEKMPNVDWSCVKI